MPEQKRSEGNAEDGLFQACRDHEVAVIARVPFDEGSLTGRITRDTTFPPGEFRSNYFGHGNLEATMDRVDVIRDLVPADLSMSQVALAFVLSNPDVTTVIPGMSGASHVAENLAASSTELDSDLLMALNELRWDRHREAPFA